MTAVEESVLQTWKTSLDASDPELHYEEEEETEEAELSDTSSILSDDSVYPCYEPAPDADGGQVLTFYQCCARNNAKLLQETLARGVSREEVTELDINGRNGLMVACFKGFMDIVTLLSKCPYVDINHQDNDGNTALMIAAQAGHVTVVNYLLNYYPMVEIEKRDVRGLTALMKAAVQGRKECVTALLLAGADLTAVDPVRRKTAREWAGLTGRFETIVQIRSILQRPRAEQFSDQYQPEWPALPELVAKALATKSRCKRLLEKICSTFSINLPHDPEADGVMDHMVRMTTCLASPFVATACQTICPGSPPEVGKRRLSVPEILKEYTPDPDAKSEPDSSSCNGQAGSETRVLVPYRSPSGMLSFLPLRLLRRNSVFPGGHIPKIKLVKATFPPACQEKPPRSRKNKNTLELPKWKYKELKEEKKKAAEAEEKQKETTMKTKTSKGKKS
ncbi:photoreceptor ankyrin repeat protein [Terrapene carolina triunguis]|uniref:photoreceptor ankyrin repeat protein n=1 Tax=Terrapene triunguis TaxID=2587831 RepID=UPI000E77545F|nr:photoreceptor ankyrin repeat protein [Terrapene carolina triunguis]